MLRSPDAMRAGAARRTSARRAASRRRATGMRACSPPRSSARGVDVVASCGWRIAASRRRAASGLRFGRLAALPGRRDRPHRRGRQLRGGHAAARRAACAEGARRAGLERGGRDRALRRQVDDDLPARPSRAAGAADLGRGRAGSRAEDRGGCDGRRPAGAEAALRLAGAGPAVSCAGRKTCPAAGGCGGRLLPAALRRRPRPALYRLPRLRDRRGGGRRHGAARSQLDHQREAGRPPDGDAARRRAGRPRGARGRRGRRGVLRRRHPARRRTARLTCWK